MAIASVASIILLSVTSISASAYYEFDVMSDIHMGSNWDSYEKFSNILKAIKDNYYSKFIVINGDMVDNCTDSAY